MRSRTLVVAAAAILALTLGASGSARAQRAHYELFAGTAMPVGNRDLGDGFELGAAVVRPVGIGTSDVGLVASWTTLGATDYHSLDIIGGGVTGRYHLTVARWRPYVSGSVGIAMPTGVGEVTHDLSTTGMVATTRAVIGFETDVMPGVLGSIEIGYAAFPGLNYAGKMVQYMPITARLMF